MIIRMERKTPAALRNNYQRLSEAQLMSSSNGQCCDARGGMAITFDRFTLGILRTHVVNGGKYCQIQSAIYGHYRIDFDLAYVTRRTLSAIFHLYN
jgi:hypothetical protein